MKLKSILIVLSIANFSYSQTGDLKTDFGTGGKLTMDIDALDELVGLTIDDQGNTYFYGNTSEDLGGIYPFDIYIGKFNSLGELDLSFGVNGIFRTDFPGFNISSINEAVYDSTGIYFIGGAVNQGIPDTNSIFVGKIDLFGQIDSSFSDDGFYSSELLGAFNTPGSLIIDSDEKVVFCGSTTNDAGTLLEYPLIGRLNKFGIPDSTFGTTGLVVWDYFSGSLINAMNIPESYDRHGEGAYLSHIIEVDDNYFACGRFVSTSFDQLQIMSLGKDGGFNPNFLSGSAPYVFQLDPGFNHAINDITYLNDKIYLAIQTDGLYFDTKQLIQEIDTSGIMGTTISFDHPGYDSRTDAIEAYHGKIFVGGYSRLFSNNGAGYLSDNFLMYSLDENFNPIPSFAQGGYFEDDLLMNDELGMDDFIFHEGYAIMGGYMNNVTESNYTDLVFMALNVDSTNKILEEEPSQMMISIFPNPAKKEIIVNHDLEGIFTLTLTAIDGKTVYHQTFYNTNQILLDLSHYSDGLYALTISNNEIMQTERIIIER